MKKQHFLIAYLILIVSFILGVNFTNIFATKPIQRGIVQKIANPDGSLTLRCVATNAEYTNCQPAGSEVTIYN